MWYSNPFVDNNGNFILFVFSITVTIRVMCNKSSMIKTIIDYMDYGRPMKPFFIEIQNFWAWAGKLGK